MPRFPGLPVLGLALLLIAPRRASAAELLMVADEFPAMQVLARQLKRGGGYESRIVAQTNLPPALDPFAAVFVYIHGVLTAPTEEALIRFTESGGRLIALHHSISSGKRTNAHWFNFLGVALPPGDVSQGGYKWIESISQDILNLAPTHPVTSREVPYPATFDLPSAAPGGATRRLPGFTLGHSEVYLNHRLTGAHTVLLGFRYRDAKTGVEYMQDHAGWLRTAGRGLVFYFQPGHSAAEFDDPAYARILLNALQYRPDAVGTAN